MPYRHRMNRTLRAAALGAALAACAVLPVSAQSGSALGDALRGEASEVGARNALNALTTAAPSPVGNDQCLPEPAAHADQMMRLHTELMLASLACDEHWGSTTLYPQYVDFTVRMQGLLEGGLEQMRRHLALQGEADPLAAFDRYRTALANEEAQDLRALGTVTYCNMMSSRYASLINARPDQFRAYVDDVTGRLLSRVDRCPD